MYRNLSFIDVLEINTYKNDKQMLSSCRKVSLKKTISTLSIPFLTLKKSLKKKYISPLFLHFGQKSDGIKIPLTSAPHAEKVELARRESSPQRHWAQLSTSDGDGWMVAGSKSSVFFGMYIILLKF